MQLDLFPIWPEAIPGDFETPDVEVEVSRTYEILKVKKRMWILRVFGLITIHFVDRLDYDIIGRQDRTILMQYVYNFWFDQHAETLQRKEMRFIYIAHSPW
jgi:hypothetical protein